MKETNDIYVVKENINICEMCGKSEDLRMGFCFDCAEAQSILVDGCDMYEDDENTVKFPVKEVNERLKKIINKGWKKK